MREKRRTSVLVVVGCIVALVWLPYLSLLIYWRLATGAVPEAEHGEISGPVLYFLPRLLVFATAVTAGVAVCRKLYAYLKAA